MQHVPLKCGRQNTAEQHESRYAEARASPERLTQRERAEAVADSVTIEARAQLLDLMLLQYSLTNLFDLSSSH